jgi:hypothetical protein
MSDPITEMRTANPYDPAQFGSIDARVNALERGFETFHNEFTSFAREVRELLGKPKDWSSLWGGVGVLATLFVAGVIAFYTIVSSNDEALRKEVLAVKESTAKELCSVKEIAALDAQRTATAEKVAYLERKLADRDLIYERDMARELRFAEMKILLSRALGNSERYQNNLEN